MSYIQNFIRGEEGISRVLNKYPERKIFKQAKVRIMAYKGYLNNYLTKNELELAKRKGVLPDRFNVHHIIPLSCKNTSFECENLVICDVKFHTWLHRYIYQQVDKLVENQSVDLVLPTWQEVQTFNNIDRHFAKIYSQFLKQNNQHQRQ